MTNLKLININNQIQDDKKLILQGLLNKKQKYLLPKYFYDEKGSKLFNKITNLKEYYPTNKELEILGNLQKEIRKKLPNNSTIVEFGSGSNKKINKFIKSLSEPKEYIPIDISKEYLFENASIIAKKFSDLKVTAICADFSQTNRLNKILKNKKKIVSFFPGSTIGNYLPKNAKKILKNFSKIIGKNSYLVIGVDLIKNKKTLENAYNDKSGVTAKFNKNILKNIKNAGSVFLGEKSPVALGDYTIGTNHVLPTDQTAKFSSGLGVEDYIKKTVFIDPRKKTLKKIANHTINLARQEGLEAHALSVEIRKIKP